ncbi:hypothetical protein [Luteibacter sp. 22Crub2.1]|uniref:hypothetical protein n=1 Tax=Luteibacter sp. 22Crub2.1 TaxID=1283288 RepID=UPI0009A7600A|nr:hypothetical protein [Luteibacter sp. 22Crub2.1]SKB42804.1 hypothetical protein SAMN05660880_01011 [Luteibacter sp. 22Crub2.1]
MFQASHRYRAWIIAIATLAAFALRCWFIHGATIDLPARGDAREYLTYASNLVRFHVFSAETAGMPVLPDSYRDPGYPAFLTPWVAWIGEPSLRYSVVAFVQAGLGAVTVTAYLLIARRWLNAGWLLVLAALLVCWPHSVTMPAYLLSETLLGFLLATGLACLAEGLARQRMSWLQGGALLFGCAGLTNAVVAPFLPLLAAAGCLARPAMRRQYATLLLVSLTLPGIWMIRNLATVHVTAATTSSSSRAMINFVQGSWPEYHDSWQAGLRGDSVGIATSKRIDKAVTLAVRDKQAGLAKIADRLRNEPVCYALWYASKPWHLWSWAMRIAAAPLYVFPTRHSPLEANILARATTLAAQALNPWIALAALSGSFLAVSGRALRPLIIPALLLLYVTVVYSIFQAEPRYAVPFRGSEFLLAIGSVNWLFRRARAAVPPECLKMDGNAPQA